VVLQDEHTIKEANQRFLEICGQSSVEGKEIATFFEKKDLAKLEELLRKNEIVSDLEMMMRLRSGNQRTCLVSVGSLGHREMVLSVVDITERKNAQAAIEEANRKLNILGSITRHDTNNKLIVLSGNLALHKEMLLDDKEKGRVEMMSSIVDSLSQQMDFAEDYRRVGINSPEWQSVQKASESAAAQFDRQGVTITIDTVDLEVLADPMLKKVFYNLIDNSLKHGGEVTEISFTSIVGEDDARIFYQDNGVGIPLDKKEWIFEDGFGRDHGLGLYLIKEILRITNIEIQERGVPGSGARFELTVPKGAYRTIPTDS
jgi:PAS domain S-box-containing protein